jgi:hypothetical protein
MLGILIFFKVCKFVLVELPVPAAERRGILSRAPCSAQGFEATEPSD